MSSEKFPKHTPGRQETEREDETIVIDKLPNKFGFSETEALSQARLHLIEAMVSNDAEAIKELVGRYYALAEEEVNKLQGEDFPRAQIGVVLAMALIRRDAGRIDDCVDDLGEAIEYAATVGYDDIVALLRRARTEVLKPLSKIGEQPSVSQEGDNDARYG